MDVGIHAVEGALAFRLEQRVELLEERFEVSEVIVEEVGIFVSVVLGDEFVEFERANGTRPCIV